MTRVTPAGLGVPGASPAAPGERMPLPSGTGTGVPRTAYGAKVNSLAGRQARESACRETSCAQPSSPLPFCSGPACIQTGPERAHALNGYGITLDVNWPGG